MWCYLHGTVFIFIIHWHLSWIATKTMVECACTSQYSCIVFSNILHIRTSLVGETLPGFFPNSEIHQRIILWMTLGRMYFLPSLYSFTFPNPKSMPCSQDAEQDISGLIQKKKASCVYECVSWLPRARQDRTGDIVSEMIHEFLSAKLSLQ